MEDKMEESSPPGQESPLNAGAGKPSNICFGT